MQCICIILYTSAQVFPFKILRQKDIKLKESLTIKVISDACGVLPQTLRAWEKRYGAFSPSRNSSGQRVYSQLDLKRAMAISNLIKSGFTISQVAHQDYVSLQRLLDESHITGVDSKKYGLVKSQEEISMLLELVMNFNFEGFVKEIYRLRTLLGVKEFIFEVTIPLLREVGECVVKGELSITHEHIVSTIIRGQLNELKSPIDMFVKSKESFHSYALATPEGNFHELSILIADLICGLNSRKRTYLGAAHPADSLAMAVKALKCDRIVLGAVHSEIWDYGERMIPYLTCIDKHLEHGVEVIIGGGWDLNFPKFKKIKKVHYFESFEAFDRKLSQSIV